LDGRTLKRNILNVRNFKAAILSLSATCLLLSALTGTQSSAQMMQLEKETLPDPPSASGGSKTAKANVTPCIAWIDPLVKPKGFLLCVHGLGLHKGTYKQFGERMARLGWGVYAMDVRGFGSFKDIAAEHNVDFPGAMADVVEALEFVHKENPASPVFIVGESMGGAIALQTASAHPEMVNGLIACVPAGERNHQMADSVKVGLHLLSGPKKDIDVTKIVVDRSTSNEALKQEWLHDSLGRFNLSPVELMEFQHFMAANHAAAAKIKTTPVLMLQGHDDQLVKLSGQQSLIDEIPSKDSVLIWVDHAEHLILEEGQFNDGVINTLNQWLSDHVARNANS
jgi:acylglycerol lipase